VTRRILLVEDEAISAMAVGHMLESLGCSVVGVTASGRDAIDSASLSLPDCVLMDIRLKGEMSGVEAAKAIQARLRIPIVFMTAYSAEEIRETYDIDEDLLIVTKPVREGDLAQAIAEACAQGGRGVP
jgi:CheY-like chemotaxis protein